MELLYEDLTYKIRGCLFEVRNEIGAGFDEESYHQGLIESFQRHEIITALQEKITQANIANTQSYLKNSNLRNGLVVNFGKTEVQITGVKKPG